ncbi:Ig-like domain-containing protein [Alteromonas naphthalenivorans]|uniref:Invasin domain-containing protein n=1 Tax=Alteromonas naphthalenivorans TaxID=715451 RepID=F5Z909_ALTNA|nr:Ig-like domain-containing protein [Alteromonas naphthalenivorans]AEF03552.1 invasin domain-containing protein [Alteromonas naphthalenivorans]
MRQITRVLSKTLWLFSTIFILAACGGGDSVSRDDSDGSDDGGDSSATVNVVLTVQNASGETDRNLTADNSLTVIATVTDTEGVAQADQLVTFALSNTDLAVFGNDTGTARTDVSGVARITINASTASGDGEITGSLSSGETGSTTFSAVGSATVDPATTVSLALQNAAGESDSDLSSENSLTAVATVLNSEGEPQEDLIVTFTLSNDELAVFGNDTGTARTNESGIASISLAVGTASGDGELTATLSTLESDTTTFSSTGSVTVSEDPASLQLYASAVQLASSGSDDIELIALIKNEQSVLMEGVEVNFSASNEAGVELQLTQSTTTADGTARALVSTQNDASNRTVTLTAQTGALVETVDILITGTEVTINGANSVILNDTAEYTLRVQDSDGVAIVNQTILLEAANGSLSETSVNTGADGQATITYTATTSGEDTITASSLNASVEFELEVQQDEFSFVVLPDEEISLNEAATISVQWLQDGSPAVGNNVIFSASRGAIIGAALVTTDAEGIASISIESDNAGFASITATGTESGNESTVNAVAQVEFIAVEPFTLIADATPDLIGPDGQTSTITAVVRDPSGNLVKNTVVNFNVDDVSTGSISPSQSTTDSSGIASTVFTSGAPSSEDAVIIRASVASDETITDEVYMTVGDRAFDISIGTGNEIEEPDSTTYLKRFAVFVSDSAGQPVSGVELTASGTPVKRVLGGTYLKGYWYWDEDESIYKPDVTIECDNEDINGNGILDVGEDTNDDEFLTPGIVGTLSFAETNITDENGQAELEYRYPANYGFWYDIVITIFGQSTGSEASQDHYYRLGVSSDDLTNEGAGLPANPFGSEANCSTIN